MPCSGQGDGQNGLSASAQNEVISSSSRKVGVRRMALLLPLCPVKVSGVVKRAYGPLVTRSMLEQVEISCWG